MSSPSSPPLILDVADRALERGIAYGTLAAAAVLPWGALPFETYSSLLVSIILTAVVATGLKGCGWLGGPLRIVRLSWLADGRWIAVRANGSAVECELCLNSCIGPFALWLRLRSLGPRATVFPLLLSRAHAPNDQLRRLVVRLRFDVPRSGAAASVG